MNQLKRLLHSYYCKPFHKLIQDGYKFNRGRINETFPLYNQNVFEFKKNNIHKHIINLHYYNVPSANPCLFYGPFEGTIQGLYTHTMDLNDPDTFYLLCSYLRFHDDPFINERDSMKQLPIYKLQEICREYNIDISGGKTEMVGKIIYKKYDVNQLFN